MEEINKQEVLINLKNLIHKPNISERTFEIEASLETEKVLENLITKVQIGNIRDVCGKGIIGNGATFGASIGTKFNKVDKFSITKIVETSNLELFIDKVAEVLFQEGTVKQTGLEDRYPMLAIVLKFGLAHTSVSLAAVQIYPDKNNKVKLIVVGVGLDGLIKMHPGKKIADNIALKLFTAL